MELLALDDIDMEYLDTAGSDRSDIYIYIYERKIKV